MFSKNNSCIIIFGIVIEKFDYTLVDFSVFMIKISFEYRNFDHKKISRYLSLFRVRMNHSGWLLCESRFPGACTRPHLMSRNAGEVSVTKKK
jgi:hypothetical protein